MKLYDHFEVENPSNLPTINDLEEYEQQYNNLLNSNVSDEEKGDSLNKFGLYLWKTGDEMLSDKSSPKEVSDKALTLGIKFLLESEKLGNLSSKKILDSLKYYGYKNYFPSEYSKKHL